MAVVASASVTLITVRDVYATCRYYKLQSSTSAVPTVPTSISTLPPSGWADTEPSYTEGSTNTLYTIDLTVFTDNTFYYTPVSVSSSYEAAKQAYNKALLAQSGVTNINTNLTNNYYTTTQADSKVSQTKSEILNSVSSTYTLKTDTQTLATRMTSAETALTADALTVKISSALTNTSGTTKLTTNGVTIDKNGLTVDGGALKVQNAGSGVLSVDGSGSLGFGQKISQSQLDISLSGKINNSYNWRATNDTTLIDGAKIYTGTVTARQLAANSLTISNFDPDMKGYMDGITNNVNQNALDIAANKEDADASIAYNSISNWCQDGDMTVINGRYIATGSIIADKMSVNELSAICTDMGTIRTGKVQSLDNNICMDFNDSAQGIQVKSTSKNFVHVINADGDRVFNSEDLNGDPVYEATNAGAKMKDLVVTNVAEIAGLRIEKKTDGWIWITGV